jgi:hypothetical protein
VLFILPGQQLPLVGLAILAVVLAVQCFTRVKVPA